MEERLAPRRNRKFSIGNLRARVNRVIAKPTVRL
jgi:hypothetical protein